MLLGFFGACFVFVLEVEVFEACCVLLEVEVFEACFVLLEVFEAIWDGSRFPPVVGSGPF